MAQIGELYMKIAGRDAGNVCVVIDVLDERFVMIDGQTRRRKCNLFHLEPLHKTVKVAKNASHDAIAKLFKEELKLELTEKKKAKKATTRPKKQKVQKQASPAAKASKKSAKKSESKAEKKAEKKDETPAAKEVKKE